MIQSGCTTMGNKLADISKQLEDLEGYVSGLLQNGLVFEKASPAMKEAYNEFSRQLKLSAQNIKSFADIFTKIAEGMSQSDSDITIEINKALAEMVANAKK
ncbi:hypothetical protein EF918_22005 [Streptomyces sp. WAC06614]|nr:hypothetical protein EF918_22005 [Streptomyces sp. WAC06614]